MLSSAVNPIQVYGNLLLHVKDGLAMHSPSMDQSFNNIKNDLTDITDAWQKIEKWKKQIMDNLEVRIRSLDQFSQSTNDPF